MALGSIDNYLDLPESTTYTQLMALADSIVDGATKRPQATRAFFNTRDDEICSCALGAAYESVTGNVHGTNSDEVSTRDVCNLFPILNDTDIDLLADVTPNPKSGTKTRLFEKITFMNDTLGLTREKIAEIIRTVAKEY